METRTIGDAHSIWWSGNGAGLGGDSCSMILGGPLGAPNGCGLRSSRGFSSPYLGPMMIQKLGLSRHPNAVTATCFPTTWDRAPQAGAVAQWCYEGHSVPSAVLCRSKWIQGTWTWAPPFNGKRIKQLAAIFQSHCGHRSKDT